MKPTKIYSIFGQVEAVVAENMIAEFGACKIEPQDIPETAAVNEAGDRAKFAVVVPAHRVEEFERRIADLRA